MDDDRPAPLPARRRFDLPDTTWSPWLGPAAILLALALALVASLIVDIPAAIFGAKVSGPNISGAVVLAETFLQDAIFVATVVFLARTGLRKVSSSQFGLVPTPWRRAAGLIVLAFVVFLLFSAAWAALLHTSTKEKLLEQLGANEGAVMLILSAALTCVIAPICEEVLFRGFVFTALRNWKGFWPAAVLTGLMFGGVHATSAPVVDLVPLAFLGFLLCVLYKLTGSLYVCIAAHALNNIVAFTSLEGWGWQVLPLLVGAFGAIFALAKAAQAIGLIARTEGRGSQGGPMVRVNGG